MDVSCPQAHVCSVLSITSARNAVEDSRKIFHNDKVTLHDLNNVYDWFSLAREKLLANLKFLRRVAASYLSLRKK